MNMVLLGSEKFNLDNKDIQMWTLDKAFGVYLYKNEVKRLIHLCRGSVELETGGILVGYYNEMHDCAIVKNISEPPGDSNQTRLSFYRGVKGLQGWLNWLWKRPNKQYYLGDWHYHPNGYAIPSKTDINQMRRISKSLIYHCPEPVLIILGGSPGKGFEIRAYIFERGKNYQELSDEY